MSLSLTHSLQIGIFTLSFAVPPTLLLMYAGRNMKWRRIIIDYGVIIVAIVGCVMGVYAACKDISVGKHESCGTKPSYAYFSSLLLS